MFVVAVCLPLVWLLDFCSRIWSNGTWLFACWHFKGKKSVWACSYCSWFACYWRHQTMGCIQDIRASYIAYYWRVWYSGQNLFSNLFYCLIRNFMILTKKSAVLLGIIEFFFPVLDLYVREALLLYCRQKKSRISAFELYSTDSYLSLLATWSQHFRLIRLGRWNKEKFLMLNPVIWMGFLLILPQLTRKPWRGIMHVFILKNRFQGRIYLIQKDFNNLWYIEFKLEVY